MTDIKLEPVTPAFGVYVKIAAEHLLDEGVAEQCLQALGKCGVLIFPQIHASDEVQVEFSNRLGKMEASKFATKGESAADDLGIYPVTLDETNAKHLDYIHTNEHWHMDGTVYEVPPKATNLKCVVAPSSGGDTEFANLYAAYSDLPEDKKAQLASLRVVHSLSAAVSQSVENPSEEDRQRWQRDGPPREQPLVWQQANGRCSLVIGSTSDHIVGMESAQSRALIEELLEWCTQSRYCYRHQWQSGDMVLFNNPGLLHRAHRYTKDSGRLMHRTTIMGTEAFTCGAENNPV